jgi:hypothetical protein
VGRRKPDPVARRIGIGLRSRQWEYDRALRELLQPLNELMRHDRQNRAAEAKAAWLNALARDGGRRLERLRHLKPPDDEWAALPATYGESYATVMRLYRDGGSPDEWAAIEQQNREVTAERERLRAKYRSAAAELSSGRIARFIRGRRQGFVSWRLQCLSRSHASRHRDALRPAFWPVALSGNTGPAILCDSGPIGGRRACHEGTLDQIRPNDGIQAGCGPPTPRSSPTRSVVAHSGAARDIFVYCAGQ